MPEQDIDQLHNQVDQMFPEWRIDPTQFQAQAGDTVNDIVNRHATAAAQAGLTEEQASRAARAHLGGHTPDDYRERHRRAQQERDLEKERQRAAGMDENWTSYLSGLLPFRSVLNIPRNVQIANAQRRYQSGQATPEDLQTIAEHERHGQILGNESTGQSITRGLISVPGMVGEAMLGGLAVRGAMGAAGIGSRVAASQLGRLGTAAAEAAPSLGARATSFAGTVATLPSMYLDQAAERNIEQGRSAYDWRGFPSAITMAAIQVGVLNSLGGFGNAITSRGVLPVAARAITRTFAGQVEQHVLIEPLAEAISHALPHAYRLETGDGLLSNAFRGKWGEAWRQFAVSAVTFAAFSGLHEVQHGAPAPKDLLNSEGRLMRQMMESGLHRDQIPQRINDINNWIDQGHARAEIEALPAGPLREYALQRFQAVDAARRQQAEQAATENQGFRQRPQEQARRVGAEVPMEAPGKPMEPTKPIEQPVASEAKPEPTKPLLQSYTDTMRGLAEGAKLIEPNATVRRISTEKHDIAFRLDEGAKTLKIDFGKRPESKPTGEKTFEATGKKEFVTGSRELAKPIHGAIEWARDNGVGIRFTAETPRQNAFYEKTLMRNGFEKATDGIWRKAGSSPPNEVLQSTKASPEANARIAKMRAKNEGVRTPRSPEEAARQVREQAKTAAVEAVKQREKRAKLTEDLFAKQESTLKESQKAADTLEKVNWGHALSKAEKDHLVKHAGLTPNEAKVFFDRHVTPEGQKRRTHQAIGEEMGYPSETARSNAQRLEASANAKTEMAMSAHEAGLARKDALGREMQGGEAREGMSGFAGEAPKEALDKLHDKVLNDLESLRASGKTITAAQETAILKSYLKELPNAKDADPGLPGREELPASIRAAFEQGVQGGIRPGTGEAANQGVESGVPVQQGERAPLPDAGRAAGEGTARPATGDQPANDVKQGLLDRIVKGAKELAVEQGGYFDTDEFIAGVRNFRDGISKMAGVIYPAVARLSQKTADAMAHFISAKQTARGMAARMIDKIAGPTLTDTQAHLYGTVLNEMRLRRTKQFYHDEANKLIQQAVQIGQSNPAEYKRLVGEAQRMRTAEQNTGTQIGVGNVLHTEQQYQQALASPEMKQVIQNWQKELSPVLDDYYRQAKGMAPGSAIPNSTQIPGLTMNLLAIDQNAAGTGPGRGALRSPKIGTAGFMKQAAGQGIYETDIRKIIDHSIATHASYAAKQEMYRTAESEGVGQWGRPGGRPDGYTEFKDIQPAAGTQAAQRGETSFFIKDSAASDFREALAPDAPTKFKTLAAINSVLTKAALASTVEAVYHSKNLMTMMMNPGVGILRLFKNAAGILKKDPATMDRLIELTRQGVSLPDVMESMGQTQGSKYNPLTAMGKGLHFLREAMVLTADDAFTKLASLKGLGVENTEANRRDFINQLGQYNIRAQNKLVQLLRDTGLGPFATAGSNYWVQGLRSMTMNPGVKTDTVSGQAILRAWKFAKIASVAGLAVTANYLLWGRVDGDKNTPLGAVKVGVDKAGKTQYADLVNLTGLTRGLRETGLLAVIEGVRNERPTGAIVDRAVRDAFQSVLHPMEGPPVAFAHMFLTGENTMGMRVARRDAESHALANAQAALMNANPLIASLTGSNRSPESMPLTGSERAWQLIGPYGVHTRESMSRYREAMHDVENLRNMARREGRRFEGEARYQRLHSIASALERLSEAAKKAAPDRQREIRDQQNRIAQQLMGL